jgi:hypothetical protein
MGCRTKADGENSLTLGYGTATRNENCTSMGYYTISRTWNCLSIGHYNDTTATPIGPILWTDPIFVIGNGSSNNSRSNAFTVLRTGETAIGHASPTQMLDVNGNARFRSVGSGTFAYNLNLTSDGTLTTATSDISMKENIEQISNPISKVKSIRGVSFTWKDDQSRTKQIGMIAQEVESILPEVVFTNPVDGLKGINYSQTTALLVEAIKEQQQQIESTKQENQQLKSELDELKALVNSLIANQTAHVNN